MSDLWLPSARGTKHVAVHLHRSPYGARSGYAICKSSITVSSDFTASGRHCKTCSTVAQPPTPRPRLITVQLPDLSAEPGSGQ